MRGKYAKFILLTPALLVVLATTAYPLLYAVYVSFHTWRLAQSSSPGAWAGLTQYRYALRDEGFRNSVVVTIEFTVLSVVLSVVIGLAIALLLQRASRMNTVMKTLLIFPYAVSPTLKGFSWRFMLNPSYGVYQKVIGTLIPPLKDTVWLGHPAPALFSIAMSEVWGWAPLIALMFLGALGAISIEIAEAAKLDGATNWQAFRFITLPILLPVILIVTLLKTIFSLKMFDQVVTMTGGGPGRSTQTLNFYVYQVGFKNLDMGYASALAILLVACLSVFAFLYVKAFLGRSV